jgi:hypothetical protein
VKRKPRRVSSRSELTHTEQRGDVLDYLAAVPISNSRMMGLKAVAAGAAILVMNVLSLRSVHRYYPVTVPFAFPVLSAGACLLVIGQPRSASGAPALWGRVLLVAALTIGAGVGVAVSLLLLG